MLAMMILYAAVSEWVCLQPKEEVALGLPWAGDAPPPTPTAAARLPALWRLSWPWTQYTMSRARPGGQLADPSAAAVPLAASLDCKVLAEASYAPGCMERHRSMRASEKEAASKLVRLGLKGLCQQGVNAGAAGPLRRSGL